MANICQTLAYKTLKDEIDLAQKDGTIHPSGDDEDNGESYGWSFVLPWVGLALAFFELPLPVVVLQEYRENCWKYFWKMSKNDLEL